MNRTTVSRAEYTGTIPRLLAAAADRDSGGIWLRSDAGSLTFGGAIAAVSQTAAALQAAGVGKGDLVMLTASTSPPYLLSWLALTSLGAVAVAVNPRSTPAELAGLISQVQPRLLITDARLADVVSSARTQTAMSGTGETGTSEAKTDVPRPAWTGQTGTGRSWRRAGAGRFLANLMCTRWCALTGRTRRRWRRRPGTRACRTLQCGRTTSRC